MVRFTGGMSARNLGETLFASVFSVKRHLKLPHRLKTIILLVFGTENTPLKDHAASIFQEQLIYSGHMVAFHIFWTI